jgi:hypothetical protein
MSRSVRIFLSVALAAWVVGCRDGGGGPDPTTFDLGPDGPLSGPIPGCDPDPLPPSGDAHVDCVNRINQLRAVCQNLPPLERWVEGEDCADQMAEYDDGRPAHAGWTGNICSPKGRGQNECPGNSGPVDRVIDRCFQGMWDEGPPPSYPCTGVCFDTYGHYINMTNPAHNRVACGIHVKSDGRVWIVQNFSG